MGTDRGQDSEKDFLLVGGVRGPFLGVWKLVRARDGGNGGGPSITSGQLLEPT